jgi:transmembrane sensor
VNKLDNERIPEPIADDLRPAFSPERSDELWRRIANVREGAAISPAGRVLRSPAFALAVAACFMIGGVVLVRELRAPDGDEQSASAASSAPLTRLDGSAIEAIAPLAAASSVPLSDGSQLRVEKGSVLAPLDVSERSVVLHLLRGRSSFAVKPGGPRRWVVEAGVASVEVVGTRFSVERDARGVLVQVEEGKVLVRSPELADGIASLSAGESLRVPSKDQAERSAAAIIEAQEAVSAMEPTIFTPDSPAAADAPLAQQPIAAPSEPSEPKTKPAPATKPTGSGPRVPDADALFSTADQARMSRDYSAAIAALERVIAEHAKDPRAKLAAFTIGRIRDEHLNDFAGATAAYERALLLGLSGSLAEDCHARLMRVLGLQVARAGLPRVRLEQAAQQYLQRYPKGRYAAQARVVLEPNSSR